jgi:general secretion pathway protein F
MPFQEAAARKPFVFGRVATALIAGGEKSGRLNEMLAVIAGYAAKERAARSTAVEALAYPVFVLFAAGCAVSFMMTVAVPRFTEAFASSGAILPWPTRVLIAASSFLASYGVWCVAACVCAAAAAWRSLRDPRRRDRVLERCVRLPFLGPLILEPAVLNVYRALAAMATGGVPLFDAVTAAAPAAGLSLVEADARIVAERIQQGFSFSGALAKTRYLKDFYPAIAAHGERTGDIARAFSAIVRELERGIAARCAVASRLIEPAVIVIVGLFIGAVVTAMALPVMTMSQLVR